MKLSREVINFLDSQDFVVINTIGENGYPHSSCKGIVEIEPDHVFLIDLYRRKTYENIKVNNRVNICAVDKASFSGYSLRGLAEVIDIQAGHESLIDIWREKLVRRVTKRVVSHIRKDSMSSHHPEAVMPHPQYIIGITPLSVIDLDPGKLIK